MTSFLYSNFGFATLKMGVTAIATTFEVDLNESATFPVVSGGAALRVLLADDSKYKEIADIVANPQTGTLTMERGKENTAPRDWPAGTEITPIISAGVMQELEALK